MKKKYFYPIYFLLFYSLVTLFFFLFGPFKYEINNVLYFTVFLIFVHLSLFSGYIRGQRSLGRDFRLKFSSLQATKRILIFVFYYRVFNLVATGGGDLFRISVALADPQKAYLEGSTKGNVTSFNYIEIILAPLVTIAITSGVFYWKDLSSKLKLLLTTYVAIVILSSIGASVRSSIVAVLLNIMCGLFLSHISGKIKINRKERRLIALFFTISVISFFFYTKNLTENRSAPITLNPVTFEAPNEDNIFYKCFSEDYHNTITGISFYLGHSYFRLGQAMDLPSNGWGYGLSNSYFLIENISYYTGWEGLKDISYGYRLDMDLTDKFGVFWSTTYSWLASDLTFPGVIVFLFFISYWMSISIRDCQKSPNIFSIAVFANLFFYIYSLPAVNPLQDGAGLFNFLSVFFIWIIFRKKSYG